MALTFKKPGADEDKKFDYGSTFVPYLKMFYNSSIIPMEVIIRFSFKLPSSKLTAVNF